MSSNGQIGSIYTKLETFLFQTAQKIIFVFCKCPCHDGLASLAILMKGYIVVNVRLFYIKMLIVPSIVQRRCILQYFCTTV